MQVLVIRPGAVGDALLAFPVITALREQYPNPHITLASNPAVLELARVLGVADEVYDFGEGRWSGLFANNGVREAVLQALLVRTEMALCWLRDPEGIVAANLRASGVARVLIAPGQPDEGAHQHIVSYLAATVGLHIDINRPFMPPAPLLPKREQNSDGAFAVHPGSGGARKCWPVESFAEVIAALWQRAIPILLLAGPADHERLEHLLALLPSPPRPGLLTQLRDVPLLAVAQELQRCRGYLGNDSGITHLAALLGLPTIVLFGPTDPVIWHPIGPYAHVRRADLLTNLHVDQVLCTIEKLL